MTSLSGPMLAPNDLKIHAMRQRRALTEFIPQPPHSPGLNAVALNQDPSVLEFEPGDTR